MAAHSPAKDGPITKLPNSLKLTSGDHSRSYWNLVILKLLAMGLRTTWSEAEMSLGNDNSPF